MVTAESALAGGGKAFCHKAASRRGLAAARYFILDGQVS